MSIAAADTPSTSTCSDGAQELDPLLKDLNERKQNFRRNVVSLAAELKHVRNQLALKEEIFGNETITRQVEAKATDMEKEISRLQEDLDDRNRKLQASACIAQQYLMEMDDLRSQLSSTLADADARAVSAQSSQLQCLVLRNELYEKKNSSEEHECRVNTLEEKLVNLQKDLHEREESQKQLKDEVLKMEREITLAVERAGQREDYELRQILEEASIKNFERISKHLTSKDEEIVKLRDEFRIMSVHWKLKTKDLQSKLENHQRAEHELKKRVLKLEFFLQEAHSQTRKLQRMGEKRDKVLEELKHEVDIKQQEEGFGIDKQNFWDTSVFKVMASMAMFVLVVFGKR
ncbi:nuclear envelope-associated protein 2-like isoform X2 [Papaver somniferum]|uniref:nuclear envelope-associated protein 2-like isoform X2 n=1 Tax=Papaver somniferum TaxID=3469 RepID=UPI000E70487B|nr:nuclear envelope-associated protein 2-like isoform X2 [Papaver somniferum]